LVKGLPFSSDAEGMKSCPGCTFLVDDDAEECRYCGVPTADVVPGSLSAPETTRPAAVPRESISTRVTAGVIVVATLSLVGIGAWAFHRSPPPPDPIRSPAAGSPTHAVHYRKVTVADGAVTYRLDVVVGVTEPDLSKGVTSKYAAARELDVVHIPSAGPADLNAMLATFSAGWPTTDVASTTVPAGTGITFLMTSGTELTHGALIDTGANGIFLVAIKAPPGSTLTPTDRAALKRATSTLRLGA
jgi:hypothetical protein